LDPDGHPGRAPAVTDDDTLLPATVEITTTEGRTYSSRPPPYLTT
jgi:hypothetical protein